MEYGSFLGRWEIKRRQSSAHYPQSNGRAEVAVKTARRILLGNINPVTGKLDTEKAARAFLAYRNTPCQDTGLSPAMSLFGRPLKDHLPREALALRPEWGAVLDAREVAFVKRHLATPPTEVTRVLEPLACGDAVQIQNQSGNRPRKWHATGVVVDCLPHRQYRVCTDGSRRVTLRNRKFLRKIDPICRRQASLPEVEPARPLLQTDVPRTCGPSPIAEERYILPTSIVTNEVTPQRPRAAARLPPHRITDAIDETEQFSEEDANRVENNVTDAKEEVTTDPTPTFRRGEHVRKAKVPFSPKMAGKTHF